MVSLGISQNKSYAADKVLKIGVAQFPSTLHPAIDSMLAKSYVLAAARRGVTIYNPDWELVCVLCTQLPSFENGRVKRIKGADGKTKITAHFTLKQTKWADGHPLTTQDVLFSYEAGKDPYSGFTNAALYQDYIEKIEVIDAYNFVIHYSKEFCEYDNLNDFEILPAHVEKKIFDKDAQNYKNQTLYDRDPTTPSLYNGPYRIDHIVKGRFVELVRNDHWWGAQKPYFDRVRIEAIENTSALTARLLAGQIDMISGELGLAFDQALNFEKRLKRQNKPFSVIYQSGLIYEHLDFNMDLEIFQDLTVRQALIYGLDRQTIVSELFDNRQKLANASVHPLDRFYDDHIMHYPYDRKRAETLLSQAGWDYGADGFRHKNGQKLSFNLYTTAGNKTREIVAQAIQSDWRMIGVDLKIKTQPPRILFGKTLRERDFKGVAMFAYLSAPNSVPKTTLHSDMIPQKDNGYAGQNFTGYENQEMDQIINELETTCTASPRMALWSRLQNLYADDLPALPLFFRSEAYIIPKNLKGVTPSGHQYATTHQIEYWSY